MKHSWPAAALSVALSAAVAFAQTGPPRVKLESAVDAVRNGTAIVTNLSSVPLSAWLIDIVMEPCSPLQPRSISHAVDAVVAPGGQMLPPSESRTEPLGASPCNKAGVTTPMRAEFRAAIFADGTTAGDPASVAMLLDNRRLVLEQYDAILNRLQAPAAATMTPENLGADLRAAAASAAAKRALPLPPVVDPAAMALSQFDAAPGPRANQIAHTIAAVEQLRKTLLESRPALR